MIVCMISGFFAYVNLEKKILNSNFILIEDESLGAVLGADKELGDKSNEFNNDNNFERTNS